MDKDKQEQLRRVGKELSTLDLDGAALIRDTLNKAIRSFGLKNLAEHNKTLDNPGTDWLNRQELGFLLTTSTQTMEEGEGVVQYLQFSRSLYLQLFTDFTECGVQLELFRKLLDREQGLSQSTKESFWKLGKMLFDALCKAHDAKEYVDTPYQDWKGLHGHTPAQFSELTKRWKKLNEQMRKYFT